MATSHLAFPAPCRPTGECHGIVSAVESTRSHPESVPLKTLQAVQPHCGPISLIRLRRRLKPLKRCKFYLKVRRNDVGVCSARANALQLRPRIAAALERPAEHAGELAEGFEAARKVFNSRIVSLTRGHAQV